MMKGRNVLLQSWQDSAFLKVIAQTMPETEPIDLPIQLREFLGRDTFGCVTILTDQGTAYILKAPGYEIDRCRGTLPVSLHHQLLLYPTAPVIRTVIGIYDQSDSSLLFESFINIEDPEQRTEFSHLADQSKILLLFYDERVRCRLSKRVWNAPTASISGLVHRAETYLNALPSGRFNFDEAKARVMEDHPLTDYGART